MTDENDPVSFSSSGLSETERLEQEERLQEIENEAMKKVRAAEAEETMAAVRTRDVRISFPGMEFLSPRILILVGFMVGFFLLLYLVSVSLEAVVKSKSPPVKKGSYVVNEKVLKA